MAASILEQGKLALRKAICGVSGNAVTHLGFSTAPDAFVATQTAIDPANNGTNVFKTATFTDVANDTVDVLATVSGATDTTLVGKFINTIALQKGGTRTDPLSRSVRSVGIGVQADDIFTIGVRLQVQDNS